MASQAQESWRPVVGFEGCYEVSSLGCVRRVEGRPLKPAINSWGYRYVHLSHDGAKGTRNVHSLVAEAFLGPKPPETVVGFRNGDRTDLRAANLRYTTRSGVMYRQYRLGRARAGHRYHPPIELDESKVQAIRALRWRVPQRELATRFGISQTTVSRIQAGRRRLPQRSAA